MMPDHWGRPDLPEPPDERGELTAWFTAHIASAIPGRSRRGEPTLTLTVAAEDVWKLLLAERAVGQMLHVELWVPPQPDTDDAIADLLGLDL